MIKIIFKDGSIRIMNVDVTFFVDPKGHKLTISELGHKFTELINNIGQVTAVYHATLISDGQLIIEKGPVEANNPDSLVAVAMKNDPKVVKAAKKSAKNFRFSTKIIFGSEPAAITGIAQAA